MAASASHAAPSNHVHALPDVRRLGLEVRTLDLSARELAGGWPFQRRILREAESAEIILAHSHYSVRSLALLRRIGVLRSPLVAFVHSLHSRAVDRIWLSGFDALLPFTVEAVEQLRAMR